MKFLIVQGSSHRKLFVTCSQCSKQFVWLRVYETLKGTYMAICRECKKVC